MPKKGVMETKKLGFLILGMSIALGVIMFYYMGSLSLQGQQLHCNPTQECRQVSSLLGVSHAAVGFLSFIFALGFYLLFFNRNEKSIVNNDIRQFIADNAERREDEDKFSLLLKPLDESERKILIAIKEQKGITQSTLRYRTDLSKAKISQVLADFEKKDMIRRKSKGKTYQVFLAENF